MRLVAQRVRAVEPMLGVPAQHVGAASRVGPDELLERRRARIGSAAEVNVVLEQLAELVEVALVVGTPPSCERLFSLRRVDRGRHSGSPVIAYEASMLPLGTTP